MVPPAAIVRDAGAAAIVKSGDGAGPLTSSDTVVVWLREPLVPVIVIVELPAGVPAAVVTFSVALPAPVIDAGANEAAALAGSPLAPRVTVPENPFNALIVTV